MSPSPASRSGPYSADLTTTADDAEPVPSTLADPNTPLKSSSAEPDAPPHGPRALVSPNGRYSRHLTAIACGDNPHTPPQATPDNPVQLSRNLPEPDPAGQDKHGDLEQVIAEIHLLGWHVVFARELRAPRRRGGAS
jgi:hypothetical protein